MWPRLVMKTFRVPRAHGTLYCACHLGLLASLARDELFGSGLNHRGSQRERDLQKTAISPRWSTAPLDIGDSYPIPRDEGVLAPSANHSPPPQRPATNGTKLEGTERAMNTTHTTNRILRPIWNWVAHGLVHLGRSAAPITSHPESPAMGAACRRILTIIG